MTPKAKKVVATLVVFLALATCYGGWLGYEARYSRFPLHRLPHWSCFEAWRTSRTNSDLEAINSALYGFHSHYGHLPFNSPQRDYQFGTTLGHDLNGLITDIDRRNPHKIVFWSLPAWEQRDGWGSSYHYHFDHDSDGMVDTGHRKVPCTYYIWSDGPDDVSQEGLGDDLSVQKTIIAP